MPETLLKRSLVDSLDQCRQGCVCGAAFTRFVGDNNHVKFVSVGKECSFTTRRNMKGILDDVTSNASGESIARTNISGRRRTFHASAPEVPDKQLPKSLCVPFRTPLAAVRRVSAPHSGCCAYSHTAPWACTRLILAVSGVPVCPSVEMTQDWKCCSEVLKG